MASGKRGARGQGRGKGVSGGGGGTSGVPFSQSGGIARTFAGGGGQSNSGGFNPAGTAGRKIGKTVVANGTRVNIRTPGGDAGKTSQAGKAKHGTGLERTGAANKPLVRQYRKSARGRGGSADT